jgi:hypothetical protein
MTKKITRQQLQRGKFSAESGQLDAAPSVVGSLHIDRRKKS